MSETSTNFRDDVDGWSVVIPGVQMSPFDLSMALPFLVAPFLVLFGVRNAPDVPHGFGVLIAWVGMGFGGLSLALPLYVGWLYLQSTRIEVVQRSLRIERCWLGFTTSRLDVPLGECGNASYAGGVLQIGSSRIRVDHQAAVDEVVKRLIDGARVASVDPETIPPVPAELARWVRD